MKNVALYNLGCKVNSCETEGMRQLLQEKGYRIVPFDEAADIYIVNTCTVTNIADRKSRQMLHRAKQRNPEAVVVAAGCYVQTGRGRIEEDDCIDLAVGNNRKKDIAEILEEYLQNRQETGKGDKTLGGTTVLDMSRPCGYEELQLKQTVEHTRAYIKIQDGCNQFCSYCAIPYARGRVRSRSEEAVVREVRGLAESGYREIVLTGIHLSSYGAELAGQQGPGTGLIALLEKVHEIPGLRRIRLGSLEPRFVTEEAAGRLAALPKLCPHFHLSLQSGCDATLKRMNRRYTTGEYYESVERLRERFGRPAITTDVIVGFPGETEEEFEATRAFLEKVGFYEMHIFKYSRRAGTAADRMPGQVPDRIKTRRSGELFELERRQSAEFRRHYIGREAEVLLEERQEIAGGSFWVGHTADYVKVAVPAEPAAAHGENEMVRVPVSRFLTDEILI